MTPSIGTDGMSRPIDMAVILVAALFLLGPIAYVVMRGLASFADMPATFLPAALRSVVVACLAAMLATSGALALALARARGAGLWTELAAMLPLGTSALAMGTGLFLLLRAWIDPYQLTLVLAVALNAALSVPFLYRILLPACDAALRSYGRLGDELGLSPLHMLRWVILPRLAPVLGFCMGLAAAVSMGDFGVVALFAAPDQVTLPVLIGRLLGAYQMQVAAAMTLWLVLISLMLFWIFDAIGARYARD
jgi:thiamine transport system permease protein